MCSWRQRVFTDSFKNLNHVRRDLDLLHALSLLASKILEEGDFNLCKHAAFT
jgi:hypothetical protein